MEANINLYHCNDEKRCLKFLSSKTYMIISQEDGKWLGSGMYFWDNYGNAKYWNAEKRKKSIKEKYIIVKARIYIEDLLDLTDNEVCRSLANLWSAYRDKLGIVENDEVIELGKKLNLLYKSIPEFKDTYKIIKIYGKYNKTPKNNLFQYNLCNSIVEPTLAVKCIYNVKCKDIIIEKVLYEEV